MLHIATDGRRPAFQRLETSPRNSPVAPASWMFGAIARHWKLILFWSAAAIFLAALYLLTASPFYTATSTLFVETRRASAYLNPQAVEADNAFIETQIEELRSDKTLLAVIDRLRLWEDADIVGGGPSYGASVSNFIFNLLEELGGDSEKTEQPMASPHEQEMRMAALENLRRAQKISRTGRSYLVEVTFTLSDPNQAATLANTVADVYVTGRAESVRNSSKWIEKRTLEMSNRTQSALRAVEEFKSTNNIAVDVNGKLTSEQELEGLSRLRDLARAESAQLAVRLKSIETILQRLGFSSAVNDADIADLKALNDSEISELIDQYVATKVRDDTLSKKQDRVGSEDTASADELLRIKGKISSELMTLANSYAERKNGALAREKGIEDRMSDVFEKSHADRQALAKLKELEIQAQIYKTVYESYLTRQVENIEQTVLPVTEARIVMAAAPALRKSWPKPGLVMLLSILLGTMIGIGNAIALEAFDDSLRRPEQVRERLGLPCLGVLPNRDGGECARWKLGLPWTLFGSVQRRPSTQVADTLVNVKCAIDRGEARRQKGLAIGIICEGESMLGRILCKALARSGRQVLLVDGDLRRGMLTRELAGGRETSLQAVVDGSGTLGDNLVHLAEGMDLLGASVSSGLSHPAELMASSEMHKAVCSLRESYDYVFVQLPSAVDFVDAALSAYNFDGLIVAVEWGRTSAEKLAGALTMQQGLAERLLGCVIENDPACEWDPLGSDMVAGGGSEFKISNFDNSDVGRSVSPCGRSGDGG